MGATISIGYIFKYFYEYKVIQKCLITFLFYIAIKNKNDTMTPLAALKCHNDTLLNIIKVNPSGKRIWYLVCNTAFEICFFTFKTKLYDTCKV